MESLGKRRPDLAETAALVDIDPGIFPRQIGPPPFPPDRGRLRGRRSHPRPTPRTTSTWGYPSPRRTGWRGPGNDAPDRRAEAMRTETELQAHHHLRRAIEAVTGRASSRATPTPGAPIRAYGTARPGSTGPYRTREKGV